MQSSMQTSSNPSKPTGIFHSLANAWTRYRNRRAAMAELSALNHGELERMVHDAGVTYGDLLVLAKQNGDAAALLYRRLKLADMDASKIDPAVMRDLQRCCTLCEVKKQCVHDLQDNPKPASWPQYCPNQPTIEALTDTKHH